MGAAVVEIWSAQAAWRQVVLPVVQRGDVTSKVEIPALLTYAPSTQFGSQSFLLHMNYLNIMDDSTDLWYRHAAPFALC